MSFARVRALVVVGLLAVFALVFVVIALVRDTQSNAGTAEGCPKSWPLADVTLREPKDVKINVYNGTDEAGLAGSVADDFRNRKFQVKKEGNAPKQVDDVAVLRFGPKGVGSAHLLRAYFLDNADPQFDIKRKDDTVDVILGNSFQQLATTTEVNQSLGDLGSPVAPPGTCPAPVDK
ncbi:LytR C-terminal domain-containing protein [Micromonospora sp. PPF5-17]|uniref:LytR family transcriptional regulator n=1 Tax=Micromonospora solifontis TaxID=2487138 RepID=A0ABX9WM70_9ACTN|nr:LytR C-terminal domain-containing protein [Micromonospora sp. PPF5-17B]NES34787.1 LytR C-terminal domain-containing protein [Micromonospora solifontis]NES54820.1 LytR C-terminal domain-containing protein [Micromonospora sp. PPF5-6]RNM01686.1 LytR family transcriptional regulator [Micromonospora solifontis]